MDARFVMDVNPIERAYGDAESRNRERSAAYMDRALPATEEEIRMAYYLQTLQDHPGHTNELAESTAVVNEERNADGARFDVAQPAKSHPNQDGSGGDVEYVQFLLPPGRRAISAPSEGPYSTGKRALAGPFFGPVKHVKAYPGDDYPRRAQGRVVSALESFAQRYDDDLMQELLA